MQIIKSPNYNQRPKGIKIDMIIIHATHINKKDTIKKFLDPKSEVSSHYLITKDGGVISFVEDVNRAWHAGISHWDGKDNLNNNSIGIEIENDGEEDFSQKQYQILANLISELKIKHKDIKDSLILGHNEIALSRKEDPGKQFLWKKLYDLGHGNYIPHTALKNDKILYKLGDHSEEILQLKNNLKSYGYKIDLNQLFDHELAVVIKVFKQRYAAAKQVASWLSSDTRILQELLKNKKNNS
jgi:N-acetylmuramoyl-L-alanine amidase